MRPAWLWSRLGDPSRLAGRGLAGLAVLVALAYLASMLAATEGHFTAQVVDLYVVCQYARAMAEGHPFQYNAGEAPTSGSTSLLHTAILAVAHALGARGEWLVAFAVLLGALLFVASVLIARRIGRRLGGEREGLLAGLLVALGGPVVWSFLYGSDIALYMFLALLTLDGWLEWWSGGSARRLALAAGALALARPEALVIVLLLALLSLGRRPATPRDRALVIAPTAVAFAALLTHRLIVGSWAGTSVADKALLPNFGLVDSLSLAASYGVDVIRGLLLGLYPAESPIGFYGGWAAFTFPPLALLLVLLAAARAPRTLRFPTWAWLGVVGVLFALVGPNLFMGVHFNRYLMWAFPGLLALTAAGLGVFTRALCRDDEAFERSVFRAVAAVFVLLGLLSTVRFAAVYGHMAGATWRREAKTAEWIARELPKGVPIVSFATSLEYLSGHRNLNPFGVMSADFLGQTSVERDAELYEALARQPKQSLPAYALSARSLQESSDFFREIAPGPPLFSSLSFDDDLLVLRTRWDILGRNHLHYLPATRAAVEGLGEVDRLDVCDVADEAAHRYRVSSGLGDLRFAGALVIDDYGPEAGGLRVADGGRLVFGGEEFEVRSHGGRDLVVVARMHEAPPVHTFRPELNPPNRLRTYTVSVSEAGLVVTTPLGRTPLVTLRNGPGWNEQVLRIPGSLVAEGRTRLRLTGRYDAYQYWFYQ
jgi:4-amino-4-deoxy-L-arabinose transferase-like glycosyltransferase